MHGRAAHPWLPLPPWRCSAIVLQRRLGIPDLQHVHVSCAALVRALHLPRPQHPQMQGPGCCLPAWPCRVAALPVPPATAARLPRSAPRRYTHATSSQTDFTGSMGVAAGAAATAPHTLLLLRRCSPAAACCHWIPLLPASDACGVLRHRHCQRRRRLRGLQRWCRRLRSLVPKWSWATPPPPPRPSPSATPSAPTTRRGAAIVPALCCPLCRPLRCAASCEWAR